MTSRMGTKDSEHELSLVRYRRVSFETNRKDVEAILMPIVDSLSHQYNDCCRKY